MTTLIYQDDTCVITVARRGNTVDILYRDGLSSMQVIHLLGLALGKLLLEHGERTRDYFRGDQLALTVAIHPSEDLVMLHTGVKRLTREDAALLLASGIVEAREVGGATGQADLAVTFPAELPSIVFDGESN